MVRIQASNPSCLFFSLFLSILRLRKANTFMRKRGKKKQKKKELELLNLLNLSVVLLYFSFFEPEFISSAPEWSFSCGEVLPEVKKFPPSLQINFSFLDLLFVSWDLGYSSLLPGKWWSVVISYVSFFSFFFFPTVIVFIRLHGFI